MYRIGCILSENTKWTLAMNVIRIERKQKGHKNISNVQIEHEEELYCGIDCF